jgi:hypothetical protein
MMEPAKNVVDLASFTVALTAWLGLITGVLSLIAVSLSIAWSVVRFYEYFKNKKKLSE